MRTNWGGRMITAYEGVHTMEKQRTLTWNLLPRSGRKEGDENKRLRSSETDAQIRRAVTSALPSSDDGRGGCVGAKCAKCAAPPGETGGTSF